MKLHGFTKCFYFYFFVFVFVLFCFFFLFVFVFFCSFFFGGGGWTLQNVFSKPFFVANKRTSLFE